MKTKHDDDKADGNYETDYFLVLALLASVNCSESICVKVDWPGGSEKVEENGYDSRKGGRKHFLVDLICGFSRQTRQF